jgi:hypothetical protein
MRVARTVSVTTTAQTLSSLLTGAGEVFTSFNEITLQAPVANSDSVYEGNSSVTGASNCGFEIKPGNSLTERASGPGIIATSEIYLVSGSGTQNLRVWARGR